MGDLQDTEISTRPTYNKSYSNSSSSCKSRTRACMQRTCAKTKKHLWTDRTKLERGFIIVLFIAIIVICALAITVHVLKNRELSDDTCVTKDCLDTASYIINSLDETQDPCNDFYAFACGRFLEDNLSPEESNDDLKDIYSGITIFSKNKDKFLARALSVIENTNDSDPKSLWKARSYYESCMDEDKIEELGVQPMLDIIHSLGGWPMLDIMWEEDQFTWEEMIFKLSKKGLNPSLFFRLNVYPDLSHEEENIFTLEKPYVNFPLASVDMRSYQRINFNNTKVKNYYHFMVNTSVLFGANRTVAELECRKVVLFEANLFSFSRDISLETDTRIPIGNIKSMAPEIDWISYFGHLVPTKITGKEFVFIEHPSYVRKIILKLEETPNRILANYIIWQTVKDNLDYLGPIGQELISTFEHHEDDEVQQNQRWMRCLDHVWREMVTPAGVYIRRFMNQDLKEQIKDIFTGIREQLIEVLAYQDGFTEIEREDTALMIQEIDHFVFPDELLDDDELDTYYEELAFNHDEYLNNVLKMKKFIRDAKLREVIRPANNPHWGNIRYPLNIYPESRGDMILTYVEIPFTLLIGLNYQTDRPHYVNYATLGAMIGLSFFQKFPQEILNILFPERDQCTVMQSSNPLLSGPNTAETIEVIGALKLAHRAYHKWLESNDEEKFLPGLSYTQEQMFWLVEANSVCGKYADKSTMQLYTKSRINGPLSSLNEFAEAFECPDDSPMNPPEKCSIW